jgi:hypothetical protein
LDRTWLLLAEVGEPQLQDSASRSRWTAMTESFN